MDRTEAVKILAALADECSPNTGEVLEHHSILKDAQVKNALKTAIEFLTDSDQETGIVFIDKRDIKDAISLFKENSLKPSANRIIGFFLGTRKFRNQQILKHSLYGKYSGHYQKGQLLDFFEAHLEKQKTLSQPWKEITYFREQRFNNLSVKAIDQLKQKINDLGVTKTKNLTSNIIQARKRHFRSHESWAEEEVVLLTKAIKYTNDLALLSECFGRSHTAIEIFGQRILYNQKQKNKAFKIDKSDPHG